MCSLFCVSVTQPIALHRRSWHSMATANELWHPWLCNVFPSKCSLPKAAPATSCSSSNPCTTAQLDKLTADMEALVAAARSGRMAATASASASAAAVATRHFASTTRQVSPPLAAPAAAGTQAAESANSFLSPKLSQPCTKMHTANDVDDQPACPAQKSALTAAAHPTSLDAKHHHPPAADNAGGDMPPTAEEAVASATSGTGHASSTHDGHGTANGVRSRCTLLLVDEDKSCYHRFCTLAQGGLLYQRQAPCVPLRDT